MTEIGILPKLLNVGSRKERHDSPELQFSDSKDLWEIRMGSPQSSFKKDRWHQKTKFPGLSYCVVSFRDPPFSPFGRFGKTLTCEGQTDGQMDGRTEGHSKWTRLVVA